MADKIYSRKRIQIPKFRWNYPEKKNFVKVIVILTIAFTVLFSVNSSIEPIFKELAKNKAKEVATEILNIESSKVLKDVHYEDLVKIEKDDNNTITMLKFDVIEMDMLASDMAYNIQQELDKEENNKLSIPLGSLAGVPYFAGIGPKIQIQIIPAGNVITDFKSVFEEKGINQTIHRIYLDVICQINIISQYEVIKEDILNQILMAESIIVGKIPESYYNLEGVKMEDTIDLMSE